MRAIWNYLVNNPIIITGTLVIIGWSVGHYFSKRRDLASKKREIRIQYLINAYRQIEDASNRKNGDIKLLNMESAIADIQLFGTKKQIELSRQVSQEIVKNGVSNNLKLLEELRADLRDELGIERVSVGNWYFLRFNIDEKS